MKDDNIILYTQIISIVGTFFVSIASVLITQYFYKKNQEKKELKGDERNRRNELKVPYEQLIKYIDSVPILAPKDIIKEININGQYNEVYSDNLKKVLENQVDRFMEKNKKANDDLVKLYKCTLDLEHAFSSYKKSQSVFKEFKEKYMNIFDLYAPYEIQLELINLRVSVSLAFTNNKIKNSWYFAKSPEKDSLFCDVNNIKNKLMRAIRKDLGIKN